MEIKTKFDRLQKVFFIKNDEIVNYEILGINIVYGSHGNVITPFVKIDYHFKEKEYLWQNSPTFSVLEIDCFGTKNELIESLKEQS